jgi:hypothetical protein
LAHAAGSNGPYENFVCGVSTFQPPFAFSGAASSTAVGRVASGHA